MFRPAGLLAAPLLLALGSSAFADVLVLDPSQDNTLYEQTAGATSNAIGEYVFTGTTNNGRIRRALLQFDVDGNIPAGSTINSVSLKLTMSMTIAGNQSVRMHRTSASWGEGISDAPGEEGGGDASSPGDATWIHRMYTGTFWNNQGGDFSATVSATQTVGGNGAYTWSAAQLATDVQDMLDNPGGNFGWLLKHSNEVPNPTAKRYGSRENPVASSRPKLTIDFTPPTTCSVTSFCSSTPNSSGGAAIISQSGSCVVSANSFVLSATTVPNTVGLFFYSQGQLNGGMGAPFGNGLRCIGGAGTPLVRMTPTFPSGNLLTTAVDFNTLPNNGQILPGSTWNFQAWFRDPPAGGASFDTSNAIQVTFL